MIQEIKYNFVGLMNLTVKIVSAHLSRNAVLATDLPSLIHQVYATLSSLSVAPATVEVEVETAAEARRPAVPIKRSVTAHHLVCLEDGKKVKLLKRYLWANYGLTPEAYRAKWNLPKDYPMAAPNYSVKRSEIAKQIGLGANRMRTNMVVADSKLKEK